VRQTVERFGGIDVLVNNASAISLTGTLATGMQRYDLMNGINARGTYMAGHYCIPHLLDSARAGRNPHILTLSPPPDLQPRWFAPHLAYSIAKYGMSLCTLAWAEEFRADGIAANSLWPRTVIATAAINMIGGPQLMQKARKPEIMGEAAAVILKQPAREYSGRFCIDDLVLWEAGVRDFSRYLMPGTQESELVPDYFLPDQTPGLPR
jgi:citronellol/citronellal dehydrogenase